MSYLALVPYFQLFFKNCTWKSHQPVKSLNLNSLSGLHKLAFFPLVLILVYMVWWFSYHSGLKTKVLFVCLFVSVVHLPPVYTNCLILSFPIWKTSCTTPLLSYYFQCVSWGLFAWIIALISLLAVYLLFISLSQTMSPDQPWLCYCLVF